jgi:hypothetical protein
MTSKEDDLEPDLQIPQVDAFHPPVVNLLDPHHHMVSKPALAAAASAGATTLRTPAAWLEGYAG